MGNQDLDEDEESKLMPINLADQSNFWFTYKS